MCRGGSTAQGCCGVRWAHGDVADVPWGPAWHLRESAGAQDSLLQDGCECAWLNRELLRTPKGFGNLKQPCLQPSQGWQAAGSLREQLSHV